MKKTEHKLQKLGLPASVAAGMAVLVSLICQYLHD